MRRLWSSVGIWLRSYVTLIDAHWRLRGRRSVARHEKPPTCIRTVRGSLCRRTRSSAGRGLDCCLDLHGLRANVGSGCHRGCFRSSSSLNENRPNHRQHRPGTERTRLAVHDLLYCFMCLSVYGIHLQPGVFHDATALIDRVGHRSEQIRLRLNRFAITLIGDMHRFDHGAIVIAKDRGGRCTDVTRAGARRLRESALCACCAVPWTWRRLWPQPAQNEVRKLSIRLYFTSPDGYHRTPTLKQVPSGPPRATMAES